MQIGLIDLFKSRKATMCFIILACATPALFIGKLDGMSYAMIVSSIVLIYNFTQHRVDLASMQIPPRGQI